MEDDILSAPTAPSSSTDEQNAKIDLVDKKPSGTSSHFRKLFIPLLAGLVLLVGLGVSLSLVQQRQNISSRASVDRVDLPLSAVSTISPDQNITVAVGINTQSYKATAVQLELTYPADKYDFVSLAPADFLTTVLTTASGGNGIASIILGSGTTPRQGSRILAVLTLHSKANSSGTTEILVSPDTVVTGIDAAGNAVPTSILGDAGSATITIATTTESPPPTPSASPTASPTAATSPTPSPTPAPRSGEPNSCGGTCGSNANCQSGLVCSNGYCRNPSCATAVNCTCSSTPTPTPTPPNLTPTPSVAPTSTPGTGGFGNLISTPMLSPPTPPTELPPLLTIEPSQGPLSPTPGPGQEIQTRYTKTGNIIVDYFLAFREIFCRLVRFCK